MKKIMKQAQAMQNQMLETQKELESMEIEGSSGGGAVKVILNGKKEIVWQHRGDVEGDEEELYTKIVELVK